MCGDVWSLWGAACWIIVGLLVGAGWYIGNKLASLVVK